MTLRVVRTLSAFIVAVALAGCGVFGPRLSIAASNASDQPMPIAVFEGTGPALGRELASRVVDPFDAVRFDFPSNGSWTLQVGGETVYDSTQSNAGPILCTDMAADRSVEVNGCAEA